MKKNYKYICDKGKLVSMGIEKDLLVIKHIIGTYMWPLVKKSKAFSFPHLFSLVAEDREQQQQLFLKT
jgi:hypothetical protein